MFCKNCAQCFDSFRQHRCPICGFHQGLDKADAPVRRATLDPVTSLHEGTPETRAMDVGIRKAVGLILIGVGCFFAYKVLVFLYPSTDSLVPGTRSISLFETAGQAILALLFGAGVLRALYAVTVERKKDLKILADQ